MSSRSDCFSRTLPRSSHRGRWMEDAPPQPAPRRKLGWYLASGAGLVVAMVAAAWFLTGPKYWTDGASVRISDRGTHVREVVWTRPQPLAGFTSDEQVYEPSVSP